MQKSIQFPNNSKSQEMIPVGINQTQEDRDNEVTQLVLTLMTAPASPKVLSLASKISKGIWQGKCPTEIIIKVAMEIGISSAISRVSPSPHIVVALWVSKVFLQLNKIDSQGLNMEQRMKRLGAIRETPDGIKYDLGRLHDIGKGLVVGQLVSYPAKGMEVVVDKIYKFFSRALPEKNIVIEATREPFFIDPDDSVYSSHVPRNFSFDPQRVTVLNLNQPSFLLTRIEWNLSDRSGFGVEVGVKVPLPLDIKEAKGTVEISVIGAVLKKVIDKINAVLDAPDEKKEKKYAKKYLEVIDQAQSNLQTVNVSFQEELQILMNITKAIETASNPEESLLLQRTYNLQVQKLKAIAQSGHDISKTMYQKSRDYSKDYYFKLELSEFVDQIKQEVKKTLRPHWASVESQLENMSVSSEQQLKIYEQNYEQFQLISQNIANRYENIQKIEGELNSIFSTHVSDFNKEKGEELKKRHFEQIQSLHNLFPSLAKFISIDGNLTGQTLEDRHKQISFSLMVKEARFHCYRFDWRNAESCLNGAGLVDPSNKGLHIEKVNVAKDQFDLAKLLLEGLEFIVPKLTQENSNLQKGVRIAFRVGTDPAVCPKLLTSCLPILFKKELMDHFNSQKGTRVNKGNVIQLITDISSIFLAPRSGERPSLARKVTYVSLQAIQAGSLIVSIKKQGWSVSKVLAITTYAAPLFGRDNIFIGSAFDSLFSLNRSMTLLNILERGRPYFSRALDLTSLSPKKAVVETIVTVTTIAFSCYQTIRAFFISKNQRAEKFMEEMEIALDNEHLDEAEKALKNARIGEEKFYLKCIQLLKEIKFLNSDKEGKIGDLTNTIKFWLNLWKKKYPKIPHSIKSRFATRIWMEVARLYKNRGDLDHAEQLLINSDLIEPSTAFYLLLADIAICRTPQRLNDYIKYLFLAAGLSTIEGSKKIQEHIHRTKEQQNLLFSEYKKRFVQILEEMGCWMTSEEKNRLMENTTSFFTQDQQNDLVKIAEYFATRRL